MTVVSEAIDPLWHEELLTIYLLNQGCCPRNELKNRIRHAQKTKVAPFKAHSESAYSYWFRILKNRGIITEEAKILSLTDLGRWVANGSVGTLFTRNQNVQLNSVAPTPHNRSLATVDNFLISYLRLID